MGNFKITVVNKVWLIALLFYLCPRTNSAQGLSIQSAKLVLQNGVQVYIDGDTKAKITINGTGKIKSLNSSYITLEGNITNQSDNSGLEWTGESTVAMVGANQFVYGDGINNTTFHHLICTGLGTKTLSTPVKVSGELTLNQTILLNPYTLSLGGTVVGNQYLFSTTGANLLVLTGANVVIKMHPVSQNSKTLNNLTIETGGTIVLNDTMRISNHVNMAENSLLQTNGKLILLSSATSTASFTNLSETSIIDGNVIVQRYIPGGSNKRKWRLLSSPVHTNTSDSSIKLNQYIDDIYVTGVGGVANGFDECSGCSPSIRTYLESLSGASNIGWTNPSSINDSIPVASGVEVFVRGSRNLANPFLNWSIPDDVTIDFIGKINKGTIVKKIIATNTSTSGDGFNLVGNPYPSTIDWMSSGISRAFMQNYMWAYNANTGNYGILSATGVQTGDPSITRYIPTGQAFFVRAISSTNSFITFRESAKVSNTPFNYFRGLSPYPVLKISLNDDSIKHDDLIINFDSLSSYSGNDIDDAMKLMNDKINIYTISKDYIPLAINFIPYPKSSDTLRLAVWDYDSSNVQIGTHELKFDSLETLNPNMSVYLLDQYTSQVSSISNHFIYTFEINTDPKSYGNNRFKLIFEKQASTVAINKRNLQLYPNPCRDLIYLALTVNDENTETLNVSITNMLGQEVIRMENKKYDELKTIDTKYLSPGVYLLTVSETNQTYYRRFIKE